MDHASRGKGAEQNEEREEKDLCTRRGQRRKTAVGAERGCVWGGQQKSGDSMYPGMIINKKK
jgi:hypothetical protein